MLEVALNESLSFLHDMYHQRDKRWLSLLGNSGVGKSMLARLINGRAVYPAGQPGDYSLYKITWNCLQSWGKVMEQLLRGDYSIRDWLDETHFLVLDEIGSREKASDFMVDELFKCLEGRLGKWTVITANLSLQQIAERLDPRISSRLIRGNNVCVEMNTTDYAMRGAQKEKAA